jgi:hypothetical protein
MVAFFYNNPPAGQTFCKKNVDSVSEKGIDLSLLAHEWEFWA